MLDDLLRDVEHDTVWDQQGFLVGTLTSEITTATTKALPRH
ncbi:hypothetical protein QQY24_21490 [Streptomyces sp. TG1A-8]|nr:hypothetical protein [Streptomyces sp. TG1A-8]MDO0927856.1 hypothetical protein [Streptomyces sp. TG1A-8]